MPFRSKAPGKAGFVVNFSPATKEKFDQDLAAFKDVYHNLSDLDGNPLTPESSCDEAQSPGGSKYIKQDEVKLDIGSKQFSCSFYSESSPSLERKSIKRKLDFTEASGEASTSSVSTHEVEVVRKKQKITRQLEELNLGNSAIKEVGPVLITQELIKKFAHRRGEFPSQKQAMNQLSARMLFLFYILEGCLSDADKENSVELAHLVRFLFGGSNGQNPNTPDNLVVTSHACNSLMLTPEMFLEMLLVKGSIESCCLTVKAHLYEGTQVAHQVGMHATFVYKGQPVNMSFDVKGLISEEPAHSHREFHTKFFNRAFERAQSEIGAPLKQLNL